MLSAGKAAAQERGSQIRSTLKSLTLRTSKHKHKCNRRYNFRIVSFVNNCRSTVGFSYTAVLSVKTLLSYWYRKFCHNSIFYLEDVVLHFFFLLCCFHCFIAKYKMSNRCCKQRCNTFSFCSAVQDPCKEKPSGPEAVCAVLLKWFHSQPAW